MIPAPPLPEWLAEQLPETRYRVAVDDVQLHVMEQGTGRPVLMVHGNPTWGYLWRRVIAKLASTPGLRLMTVDLVGLGLSSRVPVHRLADHTRWMAGLLRALDLRGAVLAVQDWGGPIGIGAAASEPDRVAGLVIGNTVLMPPKPGFRPTAFHRFSQMPGLSDLVFRGLGFPQRWLGVAQGDRSSIGRAETRAYRWPLERGAVAPLALARMVPDGPDHPSVQSLRAVAEYVEAFGGPAEIVWGTRDPILGRLHRRAARLLPEAGVTLTPAGHFLQEEVPGELAEAIRRVVDRLPA